MIGLFDSGSGGLTILEACRAAMPDEDFLYLGDHANTPYGHRSNAQILDFTRAGVDALFRGGCTLVVLACNTAAAVALRTLQQTWLPKAWPDRNVLGVLVPMVEEVTGVAWHQASPNGTSEADKRTVVLFATSKTVQSRAFNDEMEKRAPNLNLVGKACPGLVDAIESGAGAGPMKGLIKGYVDETIAALGGKKPDAVVLGCTHFPLVKDLFQDALGADVPLYCQPSIVAASLVHYLASHPQYRDTKKAGGAMRLLTTADPASLHDLERFLPSGYANFEKL